MTEDWPREKKNYYDSYISNSIVIGRDITVSTALYEKAVHVIGIDDNYALKVWDADGNVAHIISGDVSVRL